MKKLLKLLSFLKKPILTTGLHSLYLSTPTGIVFSSLDTRCFQYCNPTFMEWLGYTHDELTSVPFEWFVHPEDLARTRAAADDIAFEDGVVYQFKNRYRTASGEYITLSWFCVPDGDLFVCEVQKI